MESNPRSNLKRPFFEDDGSDKPPAQKKVRFPKGKKARPGDEAVNRGRPEEAVGVGIGPTPLTDPRSAAKERAQRRSQITTELFSEETAGILNDVSAAEVSFKDYEDFVEDGIQIEPFNLNKEREEGYFDADGNFVEYANKNEVEDAWLDSVEVDTKYAGKGFAVTKDDDDVQDLSSDDVGKIKRRIADVLEPGETVLQALRRLKGTSNNKKEKMSAETKRVFDQLTEDATNLMDNGESNVYHEKKEMFEREAEGYESLARARREGTSTSAYQGKSVLSMEWGTSSDVTGPGVPSSILPETAVGTSNSNAPTAETTSNGADAFDIFAEDDEHVIAKLSSEGSTVVCGPNSDGVSSLPSNNLNAYSENGVLQNDYVFDESSGYYYSSSLGCYYDPSTGFYCSAASGLWYSFNAETGAYDEIHQAATSVN
ncbi:LIN1-like protein [Prunus yedoensis var. nudiflora]|uniref:LIN1-like protein n=1 Tax=Prunus yedoensis var. nudiflora TaxID=2094558 RepID=A0A314Y8R2_PRUYE|nr:LIN1-like protein [Prunus yedoensis var. nudiflora]